MIFQPKLTPEQWEEAARMYAAGATYAAIGRQFDVTASAIRHHARRHGWPARGDGGTLSVRKRPFLDANAAMRRRLVRRLYCAIDAKLTLMERRMQQQIDSLDADPSAPAAPAADVEREARAIGALIRNLDKVKEFASELDRTSGGGPGSAGAAAIASEADAFRRELARRLARLVPAR